MFYLNTKQTTNIQPISSKKSCVVGLLLLHEMVCVCKIILHIYFWIEIGRFLILILDSILRFFFFVLLTPIQWIDEERYKVYTALCLSMKRSWMNHWIHCFAYNRFDCYIFMKFKIPPNIIPIWIYWGLLRFEVEAKKIDFLVFILIFFFFFQIKQQKTDLIFDPCLTRTIRKLRAFQRQRTPKCWTKTFNQS